MIKHVFDISNLTKEILYTLKLTTIPFYHIKNETLFLHDLEQTLGDIFRIQINNNTAKLIRKNYTRHSSFEQLANMYNLDEHELQSVVERMTGYNLILENINTSMGGETYMVWILSKMQYGYIFECCGDYRILEWTMDHVIDGVYR